MKRLFLGFLLIALSVSISACKNIPVKPTVSELCAKGNYEAAYKIANDEEKLNVEAENITAYLSKLVVGSMTDPGSFVLRNAWVVYEKDKTPGTAEYAVQYVLGADRYGAEDSFYVLWVFNNKEEKWECEDFITGYAPKTSENTTLEEAKQNLKYIRAKQKVEDIISYNSNSIPLSSIKNINNFFENDLLMKVELIQTERVSGTTDTISATETMSPEEIMGAAMQTAEAMRSLTQTAEDIQ